ncbi:MAG TPA: malate synthase A [Chloroflexia bacterium]|nr:malate synthase A [Chloroflexia bacterium]
MPQFEIVGPMLSGYERVLTDDALDFIAGLAREFSVTRNLLLDARQMRQGELANGATPDFLKETQGVRQGDWQVARIPDDLQRRRVEITGPAERKMMINALNSGADVFMADLEDSLSPTWDNVVQGQANLMDAVRRELAFDSPEGKSYRLSDKTALLLVRPRGWHLVEKHVLVDGEPVSASLFDFGLYFYHNARELVDRGSGPYFYLPKLESHLEARLWNSVFNYSEDRLGVPRGTIKATVLIETILAAFEMDEILYELREHAAGLNAGRWDYIFSAIKKFRDRPDFVLPDRTQVTMAVPFMRAYTQLLVKTCHRRGAHAIGGMAAFIPSRKDPAVNETAMSRVSEDKEREARDGFDGTWVAHPDLVPIAADIFGRVLGEQPHQKHVMREDIHVEAGELLDLRVPDGKITEAGVRTNISVALQYLDSWLRGNGAAAINNLMEDAATAEISRAQLWQWIRHGAALESGEPMSGELYRRIREEELASLGPTGANRLTDAARILDRLVLSDSFEDFLTLSAYEYLD